jgi:hypothetical protein
VSSPSSFGLSSAAAEIAATAMKAARSLAVMYGERAHAAVSEAFTTAAIRMAREAKLTRAQFLQQAETLWGNGDAG